MLMNHLRRVPPTPGTPGLRSTGQAMVEFAFVIVIFLGTLMLIFEGGRMVVNYFVLNNAASEGARTGRYLGTANDTIMNKVNAVAGNIVGSYPTAQVFTASYSGCSVTHGICVCRRANIGSSCLTNPSDASLVAGTSVVDVTVTADFKLIPFVGGWAERVTPIKLRGFHRSILE